MPSDISVKLHNLMAKEMGHMGKFIVKKQCQDLGIDSDDIQMTNLEPLARALQKAIVMFTGEDKAKRIAREIRKMGQ